MLYLRRIYILVKRFSLFNATRKYRQYIVYNQLQKRKIYSIKEKNIISRFGNNI